MMVSLKSCQVAYAFLYRDSLCLCPKNGTLKGGYGLKSLRENPIVSSLRDSICVKAYPALPCRATDCPVPSGLIPSSNLRFFSTPKPVPFKKRVLTQTLKPNSFSPLCGPTKVGPWSFYICLDDSSLGQPDSYVC